jgi:hypothetical protein
MESAQRSGKLFFTASVSERKFFGDGAPGPGTYTDKKRYCLQPTEYLG